MGGVESKEVDRGLEPEKPINNPNKTTAVAGSPIPMMMPLLAAPLHWGNLDPEVLELKPTVIVRSVGDGFSQSLGLSLVKAIATVFSRPEFEPFCQEVADILKQPIKYPVAINLHRCKYPEKKAFWHREDDQNFHFTAPFLFHWQLREGTLEECQDFLKFRRDSIVIDVKSLLHIKDTSSNCHLRVGTNAEDYDETITQGVIAGARQNNSYKTVLLPNKEEKKLEIIDKYQLSNDINDGSSVGVGMECILNYCLQRSLLPEIGSNGRLAVKPTHEHWFAKCERNLTKKINDSKEALKTKALPHASLYLSSDRNNSSLFAEDFAKSIAWCLRQELKGCYCEQLQECAK
jgi:hypothetical protein